MRTVGDYRERVKELRLLTRDQLHALASAWEEKSGHDSIVTIINVYEQGDSGAYKCVWPRCRFSRKDPVEMWFHVHFKDHGWNADTACDRDLIGLLDLSDFGPSDASSEEPR